MGSLDLHCGDVDATPELTEKLEEEMKSPVFTAQGSGSSDKSPWQTVTINIDGVACGSDKFAFAKIPDGSFFIYSADGGANIKKVCKLGAEGAPLNFPGPKKTRDCSGEEDKWYETSLESV